MPEVETEVLRLLVQRLEALPGLAEPVEYEAETFDHPADHVWLRTRLVFGAPVVVGFMGGSSVRLQDHGLFLVDVFGPADGGVGPLLERAGAVRRWFTPSAGPLLGAGVTVHLDLPRLAAARPPAEGEPPAAFVPCTIPFRAEHRYS